MKGFLINAVLSHFEAEYHQLSMEDLLNSMDIPVGGVYSPMGDYPDITLHDLVETTSLLLGTSSRKLSKVIGVHIFSELIAINLSWTEESGSTFELLKNHDGYLNGIAETAFPGFVAPSFKCAEISPDRLEVNFQSTFLLADIAEGLIDAMIIHNKENISVEAIKTDPAEGCSGQFILRRNVRKLASID